MKNNSEWGDRARELLDQIRPPMARQKRATLLAIADAALSGRSQWWLFSTKNRPAGTVSKPVHYRFLAEEPAYRAAYDYLVGQAASKRETELGEQEAEALRQIAEARLLLQHLSLPAVRELQAILNGGEDGELRLRAANSVLDRVAGLGAKADLTSGGEPIGSAATIYIVEERGT